MRRRPLTYASTGVDYDVLDAFKRDAQASALETSKNIERLNGGKFAEVPTSRGESAFLIETPDSYLAHVEEGLGTKNLVQKVLKRSDPKKIGHFLMQTINSVTNERKKKCKEKH